MSSSSLAGIRGPASATDNAVMRWDGGPYFAQDSEDTLSDAGILALPNTSSQVVVGETATTVTFSGISLVPHLIIRQAGPTNPIMALLRDAATGTGAPTFNYFRSRASGAVQNQDTLGIFSGNGHDGTDYAAGAQIDMAVDEADSGTAAVGSNQMGSMVRCLTSRRGTQSPSVSWRARHNGAFQLNTAMTLATSGNTGMAGAFEVDTKVAYYTVEDGKRGVCVSEYYTSLAAAFILSSTTGTQPMFPAGQRTITLPTGLYSYECIGALISMSSTSGNAAFHLLGAGTASISSPLNVLDGIDGAPNTAAGNSGSYNSTISTPASMNIGGAGTEMGFRIHGGFRVEAAGTLTPSLQLVTAAAAQVVPGSFFRCHPLGASNATCTGPWS